MNSILWNGISGELRKIFLIKKYLTYESLKEYVRVILWITRKQFHIRWKRVHPLNATIKMESSGCSSEGGM
jgi:hypothetical protein